MPAGTSLNHPFLSLEKKILAAAPTYRVRLDTEPISSTDPYLAHKSTVREVYDNARHRVNATFDTSYTSDTRDMRDMSDRRDIKDMRDTSNTSNVFDVLLWNEKNEITECSIANIAVQDLPEFGMYT